RRPRHNRGFRVDLSSEPSDGFRVDLARNPRTGSEPPAVSSGRQSRPTLYALTREVSPGSDGLGYPAAVHAPNVATVSRLAWPVRCGAGVFDRCRLRLAAVATFAHAQPPRGHRAP